MDFSLLWLTLAAFFGGILAAVLGWIESHDPFEGRKFFASIIRSFVAAVAAALAYPYIGPITIPVLLFTLLAGAGVDVLGHRLAGTGTTTGNTTTSPPK
ncbi:MAG: hypothetical protein MUP81_06700 [Dehalococcoidia bacterium]|nr:hypothetical protein [Dehalococcoidia bacterium]